MKILSRFMYVPLILAGLMLGCMLFTGNTATAQQQKTASAMDRGYRTGYTDGYQAGFVDFSNKAARDSRDHTEYRSADRAYVDTYGAIEDYKDGYRQGFEAGYDAAYDRKPFESAIPTNLRRQGDDTASEPTQSTQSTQPVQTPVADDQNSSRPRDLPANTNLRVELQSELSTDVSQKGDQFQARVIEPQYLSGAIVKGHIAFIKRPGRVKGSGEMQLAFDQIIVDGGSKTFSSDTASVQGPQPSFGRLVEAPECVFYRMNEEHGYVDITKSEREFVIGDRLHIIPNHVCVAVNLHEQVYGKRGYQVEEIWKVEGRGKLQ